MDVVNMGRWEPTGMEVIEQEPQMGDVYGDEPNTLSCDYIYICCFNPVFSRSSCNGLIIGTQKTIKDIMLYSYTMEWRLITQ